MAYDGTQGALLSNYSDVLKTFYLPAIQEALNQTNVLSHYIEQNTEDVDGINATINVHYGRNTGMGDRADGAALPEAGYQRHVVCTVPMRYSYGRVAFTGPTIAATQSTEGAYVNVIDNEITGLVNDIKKETNRKFWGCGYGILARWRSTESGTSYTLQKQYRGNSAGDGFGSTFGAKYLEELNNAVPVVLTKSTGNTGSTVDDTNIAVSAITEGTTYDTITCTDPSVTEASGTFYVRPGNMKSVSSGSGTCPRLEPMGLRGIVTDTNLDEIGIFDENYRGYKASTETDTLQGLDVSTHTWFKAIVDTHPSGRYAGQRQLTFNLMQKVFDKIEMKAGVGVGPNLILCSHAVRRELLELFQAERRTINTMEMRGGYSGVDFNDVGVVADPDAIDGEMYFLTTDDIQLFLLSDYDWMEKDGSVLSRIAGYDAYEAVLFRYSELGVLNRGTQGVLCDIAYTL